MTLGFAVVVILTGHVLADFYAQVNRVAEGKARSARLLMEHCGLYAACMFPFSLLAFSGNCAVWVWLALSLSHGLVDWGKVVLSKRKEAPFALFCIDQSLHIMFCILIAAIGFGGVPVVDVIAPMAGVVGFESAKAALAAMLCLLIVCRPGAIFVQFVLRSVRVGVEVVGHEVQEEQLKAGRWIGILERVIIVILTLYGQFDAIAFVLAAKSIARFKMLDDREFAECYLVGTLASTALAIVVALAVQGAIGWN